MAQVSGSGEDRSGDVRKRGKGFPVVALAEAVRVMREAGKYNVEHSVSAFASYMGNTTTTSGTFKRNFAAFRDWKLIVTDGNKVRMTELGKRVAIPPDPTREQEDTRQVFLGCEIFASTYRASAKGVVLDLGTIANNAVHEQDVSVVSKQLFAKSFTDSAIAAGLAEAAGEGKVRLLPEPGDRSDRAYEGRPDKPHVIAHPPAASGSPVLRQPWRVKGGQLVFEVWLDRPLPVQAFGKLETIAKAVEGLSEVLGVEGGNGSTLSE
jgi:hypothetical protein